MSKESASTPEFAKLEALINEIEDEWKADSSLSARSDKTMSDNGQSFDIASDISSDLSADNVVSITSSRVNLPETSDLNRNTEDELEGLTADIWQELSNQLATDKDLLGALNASDSVSTKEADRETIIINTTASATSSPADLVDSEVKMSASLTNMSASMSDISDTPVKSEASNTATEQLGEGASSELDEDDLKLAAIQERIDNYWEKNTPKMNPTAHALSAVLSLGFVVAAVMYGSYILAREIVARTGMTWLTPCMLMGGAVLGFYMGYVLLTPFTKASPNQQNRGLKSRSGQKSGQRGNGQQSQPTKSQQIKNQTPLDQQNQSEQSPDQQAKTQLSQAQHSSSPERDEQP